MRKLLPALILLGACSHHQATKPMPKKHMVMSRDWQKHLTMKTGTRTPAATKNVKGFAEFIEAIKANPNFLNAPVGYSATLENTYQYEGQEYKDQETILFLKQTKKGLFTLESYGGEELSLKAEDVNTVADMEQAVLDSNQFKEIKKISPTKFQIVFDVASADFKGTCEVNFDLTKSIETRDNTCRDAQGKTISTTKEVSLTKINVSNYKDQLSSIRMTASPDSLDCGVVTVEDEQQTCFDSVTDGETRDWSYLLK